MSPLLTVTSMNLIKHCIFFVVVLVFSLKLKNVIWVSLNWADALTLTFIFTQDTV